MLLTVCRVIGNISVIVCRIIDNMPVTWCYEVEGSNGQLYCNPGFPIGCYVTPNEVKKDACTMQVLPVLTVACKVTVNCVPLTN